MTMFEIQKFPQALNKLFNLFIKCSFKDDSETSVYSYDAFEILLFEGRLVLPLAHRLTQRERVKSSVEN